jgi:hypothetical protein
MWNDLGTIYQEQPVSTFKLIACPLLKQRIDRSAISQGLLSILSSPYCFEMQFNSTALIDLGNTRQLSCLT